MEDGQYWHLVRLSVEYIYAIQKRMPDYWRGERQDLS